MESYILSNGIEMPKLGLGVFTLTPEQAYNSVLNALKMGYRLIDTAAAYNNERAVGRAIKDSGIPRSEIFVSTKIWSNEYTNKNAVNETLERLGLDYVDLLFLHQPGSHSLEGYKMLEEAYKNKKIRAIGISNFEGDLFDKLVNNVEIKPHVMQVESHPYFPQTDLVVNKLIPNNIRLMSWYTLGHGDETLINQPIFKSLATKYNKTPAQIILRWGIDMGFVVIPGSKNVDHIKENMDVLNFHLSNDDLELIEKVNIGKKYFNQTDEDRARLESWHIEYEKKE